MLVMRAGPPRQLALRPHPEAPRAARPDLCWQELPWPARQGPPCQQDPPLQARQPQEAQPTVPAPLPLNKIVSGLIHDLHVFSFVPGQGFCWARPEVQFGKEGRLAAPYQWDVCRSLDAALPLTAMFLFWSPYGVEGTPALVGPNRLPGLLP
eukprot:662542-Pelagomonas_calceolata.AAC.3